MSIIAAVPDLGLNAIARLYYRRRLVVLCYHGVAPEPLPREHHQYRTSISAAGLGEHLQYISRKFQPVTAAAVRDSYVYGKPLPPHSLLVTFDDGYRNNLTHAAPVLTKYGVPAVFFVSSGYIENGALYWYDELVRRLEQWPHQEIEMPGGAGQPRSWPAEPQSRMDAIHEVEAACKRVTNDLRLRYLEYLRAHTASWRVDPGEAEMLRPMTWAEVRELVAQGFEIGSHTVDHPILSRLAPAALDRELRESKAQIERETGKPCFSIAYPNGTAADVSHQVLRATEAAGYEIGFVLTERLNGTDENRFAISRVSAPGDVPLSRLSMRASGVHALLSGTYRTPSPAAGL